MIRLIPVSRARTWMFRLDVQDAPDTKRDYSDHVITPQRLEISFIAMGDERARLSSVRMLGKKVSGPAPTSPDGWHVRLSAEWHEIDRIPEWVRPIIEEYRP